jgi:DNA polymerase-3 subunit epsilon
VIDVETTGLDANVDRVIECAVIGLDRGGRVVDEWASLVTIPGDEELGAQFVHGITRAMLDRAPAFPDILPELLSRLAGRVVVGHVLAFDVACLAAEFRRAGTDLPDLAPAGLCTSDLAQLHLPDSPRSLESCCAATGVRIVDPHTALGDARATASLLKSFIDAGCVVDLRDRLVAALALCWPDVPGPRRSSAMRRPAPEAQPVRLPTTVSGSPGGPVPAALPRPALADPVLADPALAGPVPAGPVLAGPVLAGPVLDERAVVARPEDRDLP